MTAIVRCEWCGKDFVVRGTSRPATARFCSRACRGAWQTANWRGENSPRWVKGEPREKVCAYCGQTFRWEGQPLSIWRGRKFCSQECGWKGQKYNEGPDHPNFRPDSRRQDRRGKHGSWARAVVARDLATCQHCGARGIELHAHHIKSFKDFPALRWEISNGITLCHRCHWELHAALRANGVNSGNIRPGNAEDNPEPSHGRKAVEGVTTSGRAYRRWEGACEQCGAFISKRWSDVAGKAHLFCSGSCRSIFFRKNGISGRRAKAVIATTSAPPERDDIV